MVKASHGPRRRTRSKLKKSIRERGKISISRVIQKFNDGDRVIIKVEPAVQKGMPFKRFFSKHGIIKQRRGNSYLVEVKDGNKKKIVISRPVHLKRVE